MSKIEKTPASVLRSLIDEYQISAFSLSKSIYFDYQTLQKILKGKGRVTVSTAIKLGKYFGQSPSYWIDLQASSEIEQLLNNKKFVSVVNKIAKAQKPSAKNASGKRKTKTFSEKRKKAAKVPGARKAKRSR